MPIVWSSDVALGIVVLACKRIGGVLVNEATVITKATGIETIRRIINSKNFIEFYESAFKKFSSICR